MNTYEEERRNERKMDRISEQIEELMLDAMIAALKKIKDRNDFFRDLANKPQSEPYPF